MTESERIVYLAGFFDGEGSVIIAGKHSRSKKNGRDYYSWHPHIAVANNCEYPVKMFADEFGGKVIRNPRQEGRCCYTVKLICGIAANALERMLPYLHVKDDQARIAIELHHRIKATIDRRNGLSQEERKIRMQMQLAVRELNGRYNSRALKGYQNAGESTVDGKWSMVRTGGRGVSQS